MQDTLTPPPLWPGRRWWLALLVIVVIAGALRYTGYDFSLPYVDHPDEPNYNLSADVIVSGGLPRDRGMHGYPPGIVLVNAAALVLSGDPALPPSHVLPGVRLVSITVSVLTVLVLALLGHRLESPAGGLFAAWLWAVAPPVVEMSRYATADVYVTFFALAMLYLALTAVLLPAGARSNRWMLAATVAAMLAILFKYQAVFMLPVLGVLAALRLRGEGSAARRGLLANAALCVALLAVFALVLYLTTIRPMQLNPEPPTWYRHVSATRVPPLADVVHNLQVSVEPATPAVLLWLALPPLALLLLPRFSTPAGRRGTLAVVGSLVLWVVGITVFGRETLRQLLTAAALVTLAAGVGLGVWVTLVEKLAERWAPRRLARLGPAIAVLPALALVAALSAPSLRVSAENAREHTLPDRRNDLADWANGTLLGAPYVGTNDVHKVFNPPWGGYRGQTGFGFVKGLIDEQPLDAWREQGVEYAIIPYWHFEELQATPEGRARLQQMQFLKAYPPDPAYRGPSMVVYRLYPMQHAASGELGPIRLAGYDVDRVEAAPGESVTLRLYWQAGHPTDGAYTVYNHLTPPGSREIIAQADGPPLPEARRSTAEWHDPDEVVLSVPFVLSIGADVPPGEYRLLTGFYHAETGARLLSPGGDDYLTVTTITVIAP